MGLAGVLGMVVVAQLPVLPGASGFGIHTPAGRGGTVHVVRSLAASGPETLAECVAATGPRVCIFEVSGTITLSQPLEVLSGNLTIAGQTAPSPGILVRGAGLQIRASDVLVQHLRFRVGDDAAGPPYNDRDALQVLSFGTQVARNIVVDHCSFSWSMDELLSLWSDSGLDRAYDNITLRSNVFAEPLHDSFHTSNENGTGVQEPHGYGPVLGGDISTNGHVDLVGNLFAFNVARNPLSGATYLAMVNNVIYGVQDIGATQLLSYDAAPTFSTVMGNVYRRVANPAIRLTNLPAGSQVFLGDNQAPDDLADPWSVVEFYMGGTQAAVEAAVPPSWPMGLVAQPAASTLSAVLGNAGARPADRDAVDLRVVQQVTANTGGVVNCVADDGSARCAAHAGGWPQLAQNNRPLTPPADPHGDTDGDGYTNLEEWLHDFSAVVEGTGPVVPPPNRFSPDALHGQRTDFEELTPARWAVVSSGNNWRYAITTSQYDATPTSGLGEYALSRHGAVQDFRLQLRFASTEDLQTNPGADVCLVFGFQDSANYLYLMLSAVPANSQLFRYANGTRTLLADVGVALVPDTLWHDVVLQRVGTAVTATVDGVTRLETTAADFPTGRVGVGSFNDAVMWDDVELVALAPDAGHLDAGSDVDAAGPEDAGGGSTDAATLADAGNGGGMDAGQAAPDAGAGMDAGFTGDGSARADGGTPVDPAPFTDSGMPPGAGTAAPPVDCTCHGARQAVPWGGLLLLLARRRRRGSTRA